MCVFVSSLALNSTQTSEARPVGCRTEKMDWNPSQSGSRSAWSLMSCFVTVFVLYSVLLCVICADLRVEPTIPTGSHLPQESLSLHVG